MFGPWTSDRLIYRAVEPEDEPFLFNKISSDAEGFRNATPFMPVPRSKKSSSQYREYLENMLVSAVICLPPKTIHTVSQHDSTTDATPIGVIHLSAIDPRQTQHRQSELGLNIARQYQGQGYGTESIKWALNWGFRFAALHRIELGALGYNTGAIKLYERLGFVAEGRKRDFIWFDGKYWDLHIFSMLEDEWREKFGRE